MSTFDGNRTRCWLAVLCVAQFVVVLDATAVTGALPALGRELGFTAQGLQWVVTAYPLTLGGFLIVVLGMAAAWTLPRRHANPYGPRSSSTAPAEDSDSIRSAPERNSNRSN